MEIYYFSGTGNSYSVADELAKNIKETDLIPIVKRFNENNFVSDAKKIGFVFPVYYYGLPVIVENFLNKIIIDKAEYIFYIATSGDPPGKIMRITDVIKKILKQKNKNLDAGFRIMMPSNYIIMFDLENKKIINDKIRHSKIIIKTIANIISNNKKYETADKSKIFSTIVHWFWELLVKKSDKRFYTDDKCNSCGICVKVCPVNNIKLNKKPVWLHNCEECLACINFCPEHSIQSGKVSLRNSRYHHPEVEINNIISQK